VIGTISWFNKEKGIGFVHDEKGQDHFIHYKELKKTKIHKLNENDEIEFEILTGPKGTYITNVSILNYKKSNIIIKQTSNLERFKKKLYNEVDHFNESKKTPEDFKNLKSHIFSQVIETYYGKKGLEYFYDFSNQENITNVNI
jgi:CspA family cold shock protein